MRIGVTGSVSTLRFYTDSNTGYPDQDGNTMTQSYFNETYTSSNDNPKMVIANNGNVGIGYDSPEYHLDIRGSGYQIINVYSDGTGDAYARFSYNNNQDAGLLYVGAASNSVYLNSRFNYPMIFYIDNIERFRIETDGRFKRNDGSITYCYADAGNLQWHAGSSMEPVLKCI